MPQTAEVRGLVNLRLLERSWFRCGSEMFSNLPNATQLENGQTPTLACFSCIRDGFRGPGESAGWREGCPGLCGGSARPRASTKGALAAAGKHDIITVEGTVLSHPGQSVYQALTVH